MGKYQGYNKRCIKLLMTSLKPWITAALGALRPAQTTHVLIYIDVIKLKLSNNNLFMVMAYSSNDIRIMYMRFICFN